MDKIPTIFRWETKDHVNRLVTVKEKRKRKPSKLLHRVIVPTLFVIQPPHFMHLTFALCYGSFIQTQLAEFVAQITV